MKNKRKSVISIVILILLIIGIITIFSGNKKYILKISKNESIVRIISQRNDSKGKLELISKDIISQVVEIIKGEGRKTKKESISDQPNVEKYYTVTFKDSEEIIYIYEKEGKYYIEQPYNGIYEITLEEHNKIMEYLAF